MADRLRHLYSLSLYLLAPCALLRLFWLGRRDPDYRLGWAARFGLQQLPQAPHPLIWIHAVSVGEVKAASSLVHRLRANYPDCHILVTTITATGAAITRQIFGDKVMHLYLPYDLPHAIRGFLDAIRPEILIVMETELWPNLYHQANERGIKIVLVNARLSNRSFARYRKVQFFMREVLRKVSVIAAQTTDDALRFGAIGGDPDRITITGNIKFDVTPVHSIGQEGEAVRAWLSSQRPVWIAASTHEGEERLALDAHKKVLERHPDCLLIIAPRHPERFKQVLRMVFESGYNAISRSMTAQVSEHIQVLILDSMGELPVFYAAADLAFVGGSLLPHGGHNVLEPAMAGIPVLTGRHTDNFREITRMLEEAGALRRIEDENELAAEAIKLLANAELRHVMGQAGKEVVAQNRGSVDRVMELIRAYLPFKADVSI
jgi:3-deoxy-D-manno-octulosonic-acid transferase